MHKRFLSVLLAAILFLSLVPMARAANETRLYDWAFEIFDDMNELRAENGIAPLTMDETFLECAMTRAKELAANYSHTRPNGRQWYTVYTGRYKSMGENIGYGYSSAQEAHQLWANSREHRENILNPDYAVCGVGMVRIGNTVYGVELFGDASCLKKSVTGSQYGVSGGNSAIVSTQPTNTNTSTNASSTVAGFADVPANSYYADAVKWAAAKNIVTGTGVNTFSPNSSCTRAQIVTFLWRAAGAPRYSGSCPFRDVRASDYYYQACIWASRNGIAYGTDANTFSPNRTCTRAEAVTFLWRNAGSPRVGSSSGFRDVPSGAYYATAVTWAHRNGIAEGTSSTTFSPEQTCTRAQIVEFIYRWKT